jgi:Cu/Ag efflux protein CusF
MSDGHKKKQLEEPQNEVIVPHIESDIPLPASAVDAFPDLSPKEELDMRTRTIMLIAELNNQPLAPTEENKAEAQKLAKEMIENPKMRPEFGNFPNETLAYLAGMVTSMNHQIVDDLAELKQYVVNKLVYEIEHSGNAKDRLKALRDLGEVDGVDAFKKRTEVTVKHQTIEEVEKELLDMVSSLKDNVIDVEAKEVRNDNDSVA